MNRARLAVWLEISAIVMVACSGAWAQQPTDRERELEELVRKLNQRVEALEGRLNALEGGKADAGTEARVEQLEQSVEQIKQSQPPAADSEEWKAMKEWVNDPMTLRPYWKDALNFKSTDGSIKLKIGGRIHYDWAFYDEDDLAWRVGSDFNNDSEFRRARIYISGDIHNNLNFKAQYDFAGGDADFKDVYIGVKKVPYVGNLRFGQFKEPFSLEELTSSNDITFMERSLVNTFAPSRNAGVMAFDTMKDESMTWAVGVFRQSDDFGDGMGGRDYNLTGRVTWLPVYEDDGRRLIHLGASYSHQNYENDTLRYRARPETHLSPRVVDTGNFSAEYGDLIGFEAAWVEGPFSLQGEYAKAMIEGRDRNPFFNTGNPKFVAFSVQASYFLTGEHRPYKKSEGVFDRVRPKSNFGDGEGTGAWEVAARYSYLDLNEGRITGGRLEAVSLDLNWYWNPNMKMMWNYVFANPSNGGDVDILQWRVQLAF